LTYPYGITIKLITYAETTKRFLRTESAVSKWPSQELQEGEKEEREKALKMFRAILCNQGQDTYIEL